MAARCLSASASVWRFSSSLITSCRSSGWLSRYSLTMRSISPRCSPVKDCAAAGAAAGRTSGTASRAAANERARNCMVVVLLSSIAESAPWRLVAGDVVGLDPAGRPDRETRLGAGGDLARGLEVAAHEGRLGGGEIRVRQVVLLAVGHREVGVGVGRLGLARQRRLQDRHRL